MKTLRLLALLLFPAASFAQLTELQVRQMVNTASEPELVMECSRMMQENYFYQAEIVVDKLLTFQPNSPNYNYRKGFIVLDSRNDFEAAMLYFRVAITDVDKNYDAFSHREKSAPIDAFFHLGRCHHLAQEMDLAIEQFQNFIDRSSKKSERVEESQLMIKQCNLAKTLIANPKSAVVKNIGPQVNTAAAEFAPVVSLDGTSLYFTSRRQWEDFSSDAYKDPLLNQYPEDIYVSYQDFEGEWTSPEKLAFCDARMNEATIAVSSDERKIYVYQDATGGGDIYYSNFSGNKFEELSILEHDEVNTKFWETHCTVTPDGQNMYFVSDRPGGYGGRDIYRVVKLPNGEWSKAQNMGPLINTPYDEDAPFIDINNKTLYYASNGPNSMGGFDIFVTFRDAENNWSDPVNLGYPINSTGDDVFYTTTIDGLKGYLTSFRKGGYGEKDIYEIQNDYLGNRPISSLKGSFKTLDGTAVPNDVYVKLTCENCDNQETKEVSPRMKRGSFFAVLERCKDYKLDFFASNGTLLKTENFVTKCNSENEEITKVHYLGDYQLTIAIADASSLKRVPNAKVEVIDPATEQVIATYTTDANGVTTSDLIKDGEFGDRIQYNIHVIAEGYLTQTFVLDTTLADVGNIEVEYLIHEKEIGVDIGVVFHLNPIYFDFAKWDIRPDAAHELDKIVEIMNENPTLKIELGSHTDCRASKAHNKRLSDKRAKSSADYIRKRISDPKRIYGKGYGESQLVNDCGCEGNVVSDCSEEEHQANRRTEFRVVK